MQEWYPLKQVGFFITCSKLEESAKSWKFLSYGVILKSNSITFSYVSKYMEGFLDKLSKDNTCFGLEVYMHLLSAIFWNRVNL